MGVGVLGVEVLHRVIVHDVEGVEVDEAGDRFSGEPHSYRYWFIIRSPTSEAPPRDFLDVEALRRDWGGG